MLKRNDDGTLDLPGASEELKTAIVRCMDAISNNAMITGIEAGDAQKMFRSIPMLDLKLTAKQSKPVFEALLKVLTDGL